MTNCIKKKMLVLFLDQELPANQIQDIRNHINQCPDCQKRLGDIQSIDAFIGSLPEIDVPENFDTEFWKTFETLKDIQSKTPKKRLTWKAYTAAGIAAMLIMFGGISLFSQMESQSREMTLIEDIDMFENYELAANIDLLENWDILMQMDDKS